MSDKINGFTVILDTDIDSEYAELLADAIRMHKHVISVEAHCSSFESKMAEERAKRILAEKLWKVLEQ